MSWRAVDSFQDSPSPVVKGNAAAAEVDDAAEVLQHARSLTAAQPRTEAKVGASVTSAGSTPPFWTPRHSSASGGGSHASAHQVRLAAAAWALPCCHT